MGSEIRAESHQLSSDPPSTALLGLFEGLQILHALGVVGEASHGFHDLVFAFHDLCLHEREQKAGAASWGRGSSVLGTPHGGVPKANQRKTLTPSCSMMAWSHMIFYQTKTPKKHPKKDVAWCSRMTYNDPDIYLVHLGHPKASYASPPARSFAPPCTRSGGWSWR